MGINSLTEISNSLIKKRPEIIELFALNWLKIRSFFAIAADTDGIDGTENNAGAIIDENTLLKIRNKKLSPEVLLLENNSYLAFKKSGDLFVTGPTGTNVNDFRAIIINY